MANTFKKTKEAKGPKEDKAMSLTHLESTTGHPALFANRQDFAAGEKSTWAHVAREHFMAMQIGRAHV